jgi:hypothetical protein
VSSPSAIIKIVEMPGTAGSKDSFNKVLNGKQTQTLAMAA